MSESIIQDNNFLLYSFILGVAVTFLYDLLRVFRRVIKHPDALVSIEDFLYWVIVAISVFYMMHTENNGTLRWFAILGAGAGMFLYKKLISRRFVDIASKFLEKISNFISKILKTLFSPIGVLGKRGVRFLKKKLTRSIKTLRMILCKQ